MRAIFVFCCFICGTAFASYKIVDGRIVLESLEGYSLCARRSGPSSYCDDALERYLKTDVEKNWDAALLVAEVKPPVNAIPFFFEARTSPGFQCGNETLLRAIESAYKLSEFAKDKIDMAHQIAFERCGSEMPQKIKGALDYPSYAFDKYCGDFLKKGFLAGLKKKRCKAF